MRNEWNKVIILDAQNPRFWTLIVPSLDAQMHAPIAPSSFAPDLILMDSNGMDPSQIMKWDFQNFWYQLGIFSEKVYGTIWPVLEIVSLLIAISKAFLTVFMNENIILSNRIDKKISRNVRIKCHFFEPEVLYMHFHSSREKKHSKK